MLLHELSHMAGNKKHRARCANPLLDEALGAASGGRGTRDKWFGGCSATATATASAASAPTAKQLVHRVIEVD